MIVDMTKIPIFLVIAGLLGSQSMITAKEMPLVSPTLAGMSEAGLAKLDAKLQQLIAD